MIIMEEKKHYNKIVIITNLLLLFTFSCKKDANKSSDKLSQTTAFVKFDFPDTVNINKFYNGKIKYKSVLDTITTNVIEEVDGRDRYITYSLNVT